MSSLSGNNRSTNNQSKENQVRSPGLPIPSTVFSFNLRSGPPSGHGAPLQPLDWHRSSCPVSPALSKSGLIEMVPFSAISYHSVSAGWTRQHVGLTGSKNYTRNTTMEPTDFFASGFSPSPWTASRVEFQPEACELFVSCSRQLTCLALRLSKENQVRSPGLPIPSTVFTFSLRSEPPSGHDAPLQPLDWHRSSCRRTNVAGSRQKQQLTGVHSDAKIVFEGNEDISLFLRAMTPEILADTVTTALREQLWGRENQKDFHVMGAKQCRGGELEAMG
ncbi:hypothetical protein RRG08_058765 [Elysia crispata]|uniref:Uncharacterized protein n=1 Tax=Elysia crispata TaxID=231223 RepID=A0AAE0YWQ8_9GAST|nr:hypothetical protein RRG08_058765 [Elysia crispata]